MWQPQMMTLEFSPKRHRPWRKQLRLKYVYILKVGDLAVRTGGDPASMANSIAAAVRSVDSDLRWTR